MIPDEYVWLVWSSAFLVPWALLYWRFPEYRRPRAGAGAQVDERLRATASPEWDVLEEHVVSELMTRRLCELPPETGLQEAAEFSSNRASTACSSPRTTG